MLQLKSEEARNGSGIDAVGPFMPFKMSEKIDHHG